MIGGDEDRVWSFENRRRGREGRTREVGVVEMERAERRGDCRLGERER